MAKYRILSIDGGGIRGIVTTVMMQRLQDTHFALRQFRLGKDQHLATVASPLVVADVSDKQQILPLPLK